MRCGVVVVVVVVAAHVGIKGCDDECLRVFGCHTRNVVQRHHLLVRLDLQGHAGCRAAGWAE